MNINCVNLGPKNISSFDGTTTHHLSISSRTIIFLISCPPTKNDAICAEMVSSPVKPTTGNSFSPGVASPVLTNTLPIIRPGTTIIKYR